MRLLWISFVSAPIYQVHLPRPRCVPYPEYKTCPGIHFLDNEARFDSDAITASVSTLTGPYVLLAP